MLAGTSGEGGEPTFCVLRVPEAAERVGESLSSQGRRPGLTSEVRNAEDPAHPPVPWG